jgi:hypothetical protein
MVAGPRQLLCAATAASCIALALPAIALANGGSKCNASACKVYIEPNAPSAGKQQSPTGSATSSSQTQQPKKLRRVLLLAGKDRGPLSRLMKDSGISPLQGGTGNVVGPSLLGAALDLGAGPLALLAILLASALALGAYGIRHRQRRRPTA